MKDFPVSRMAPDCIAQLLPFSKIITVGWSIIRLYQNETHANACVSNSPLTSCAAYSPHLQAAQFERANSYEYQLCGKCHASGVPPSAPLPWPFGGLTGDTGVAADALAGVTTLPPSPSQR
jgi:hypothetical protein